MTSPAQAVTTDDGRYYLWPRLEGVHLTSITTVIKQGVPKPQLDKWMKKKVAECALEHNELLRELSAKGERAKAAKNANR